MAWRILIRLDEKTHRVALVPGEHEVGSRSDCAVSIPHPTVSRRHAVFHVTDTSVRLVDAGSRNGMRVDGARIDAVDMAPGQVVHLGGVPITLEMVPDTDLEAAVVLGDSARGRPDSGGLTHHSTHSAGTAEEFATRQLPQLLTELANGASFDTMVRQVGAALFASLPCFEATFERRGGIIFTAQREGAPEANTEAVASVAAGDGAWTIVFPAPHMARAYRPILELAAQVVTMATPNRQSTADVGPQAPPTLPAPVTVVPAVKTIYADAARVARGDVGVMILGESGTGKEVLSRYLHRASNRRSGPFLGLNCAALPRELLESELFGIEKGVATGVDARAGRFELASGGTLFLDEIGDMAADTQAKILRVLQSGEVYRLGAQNPRTIDVRIVAATNQDIRSMLADGSFRADLFHRIATWVVDLPPLRHRRADIPNLAAHFLSNAAAANGVAIGGISRAALDALLAFRWPGNIRQLENEMSRAALFLDEGELLDTARLSEEVRTARSGGNPATLAELLERVERDEIVIALEAAAGNTDEAAERLGLSRATLYRRIKALGI